MKTPPDLTLTALREEFPGYRVWLEPAPGRYRFIARRLRPGTGPHTIVTSDPAELRAALTPSAPLAPDTESQNSMPATITLEPGQHE